MTPEPVLHHLSVSRDARYYTAGDPAPARTVWFALHGYGQLAATFITYLNPLCTPGRLIVAPEALSRFYLADGKGPVGASWMTREDRDREIADYIRYLDATAERIRSVVLAECRFYLLGFSQGVATASRWASHGATRFAGICLWAGSLPPDLALQAFSGKPVALVAGHRDSYLSSEWLSGETERLSAHGVSARSFSFHGGHRLDRITLAEVASFLESPLSST